MVGVRLSSATVMTSYCARSSTGRVEFPARKQCRGEGRTKHYPAYKISVPNLQAMAEHDRPTLVEQIKLSKVRSIHEKLEFFQHLYSEGISDLGAEGQDHPDRENYSVEKTCLFYICRRSNNKIHGYERR